MAKFLGVFNSLSNITVSPQNGDTVIIDTYSSPGNSNSQLYIFDNNDWEAANYVGTYVDNYSGNAPNDYSIISIVPEGKPKYPFTRTFKIYKNNAWEDFNNPVAIMHIKEVD